MKSRKKSPLKKAKKKSSDSLKETKAIIPEIVTEVIPEDTKRFSQQKSDELEPLPTPQETGLIIADPVTRYMAEIKKYPLLSKEEEKQLALRYYEHGDREAAQKLVTSNLRFVVKVASEYTKFGARLIDLIQEGNVGLMQAVREYNPYKDVRLITYAVWWIRGQIQDYLMRHYSMVKIGTTATKRKLFYELQRQRDQLERMGFEAGIAQLSGRMGISEEEVKEMGERVLQRDVSLNYPGAEMAAASNEDPLQDDALAQAENLKILEEQLEKIKPELNEKEKYLLEKRLLADEPLTLQQIGDHFKMTREASRQLEARLIEKIRKKMIG